MLKTVTMYRLEEETGKDIRQIIWETVRRHGSISAAAGEFRMTRVNLQEWITRLDGHSERRQKTEVIFDGWEPDTSEVAAEDALPVPA